MPKKEEFKAGEINIQIFKVPSGNVRGIAFATYGVDRIAHAYLHTTEPPSVTLDKVKGKPSLGDVRRIADTLIRFVDAVEKA